MFIPNLVLLSPCCRVDSHNLRHLEHVLSGSELYYDGAPALSLSPWKAMNCSRWSAVDHGVFGVCLSVGRCEGHGVRLSVGVANVIAVRGSGGLTI